MLSKKLLDALNVQFNYELESANIYLAMAGYTSDLGLGGFTNWFMAQYEEELFHAKKIMKFINDKNIFYFKLKKSFFQLNFTIIFILYLLNLSKI